MVDTSLAVLVVDDMRTMTKIMTTLLRQLGLSEIDVAHDGNEALECLRAKRYNLVLSDLEMSPISGIELVRRIRAEYPGRVKTLLTTANHERISQMVSSGNREADGYILKPFKLDTLRTKIQQMFVPSPIVD